MKKIPMFFALEFNENTGNRDVINMLNDKVRLMIEEGGEFIPTLKLDGTAVRLTETGEWQIRRAVSNGKKEPEGYVLEEYDENTGRKFGWEPPEASGFNKFFKRALENIDFTPVPGTYELCGPKINGNPEGLEEDTLFPHGTEPLEGFPTLEEILEHDDYMAFLEPYFAKFRAAGHEGIVWWKEGNPVFKLRCKDFFPEMDARY